MGCTKGAVRCVLVVFNSIFTLLALALLSVGIFVIVSSDTFFALLLRANAQIGDNKDVNDELNRVSAEAGLVKAAGYTLTGVGAFVLLLSFVGCIGALTKSKCLLAVYCILLSLLAAAKIGCVVVLLVSEYTAFGLVGDSLLRLQDEFVSINDMPKAPATEAAATHAINTLQVWLDCCGAKAAGDIANSSSWQNSNRTWTVDGEQMQVPATCCPVSADRKSELLGQSRWQEIRDFLEDPDCPITAEGVHTKTCTQALGDGLVEFRWPAFGTIGAVVLLELLLICLALMILCSKKRSNNVKNWN